MVYPIEKLREVEEQVAKIAATEIPSCLFHTVEVCRGAMGSSYMVLIVAVSDTEVHSVSGQYPQRMNLILTNSGECYIGHLGGMGAFGIGLKPAANSYMAIDRLKFRFRKPKKDLKNILKAYERFCQRYVEDLKNHSGNLYGEGKTFDPIEWD